MLTRPWRRRPPVFALIERMEQLMATIADLTTAVQDLTDVEQQVLAVLTNPPSTGTVLSAEDQAALDAAVAQVNTVAGNLAAALPPQPAPPAEPPADGGTPTV